MISFPVSRPYQAMQEPHAGHVRTLATTTFAGFDHDWEANDFCFLETLFRSVNTGLLVDIIRYCEEALVAHHCLLDACA